MVNAHEEFEKKFGADVRKWRKYYRMSQEELAQRMTDKGFPMHQTTIGKLEAATRPITLAEASALENIFWLDCRAPRGVMPINFQYERTRLPGLSWIPERFHV